MKNKLKILIFLILPLFGYSQNVNISGKVIHYTTLQPMFYTQIMFDTTNQVIANEQGEFEFEVPKQIMKDTLKIRYLGCFDINFINLPTDQESINLGSIPIFDYFPGYDMTHFNCADKDFDCKEKEKKHIEKENERIKDYFTKVHNLIENFDFVFQHETFKIDIETGCINLRTKEIE